MATPWTLAERWAVPALDEAPLSATYTARRFAAVLRERRTKPVLAVVHTFSTHNLLLRYWLATGGINRDRELTFTVVPPADTVEAMGTGKIDGFCAGAPWGEVAARTGLGRTVATSHAIWNHGTEKVFAARRELAEYQPDRLQAALRALLRAAIYCDSPEYAPEIAATLSQSHYLGVPAEIVLTSLREASGPGRIRQCRCFGLFGQCS
jgi:ABC-type nitrate/sulfonate/bicarbonate transport system substrate-binding protein